MADEEKSPAINTASIAELADALARERKYIGVTFSDSKTTTSAASGTSQAFGAGTTIGSGGGKVATEIVPTETRPKRRQSRPRFPTEELPPDAVRTKRVHYDQVRAIAMAPRDGIGGFGWAALGGLTASLPATAQDIWASYVSMHAVALPPGRLLDIAVTIGFLVAFGISRFWHKEATSKELLERLFPEPTPKNPPAP